MTGFVTWHLYNNLDTKRWPSDKASQPSDKASHTCENMLAMQYLLID